jgi:hypothetical protein
MSLLSSRSQIISLKFGVKIQLKQRVLSVALAVDIAYPMQMKAM